MTGYVSATPAARALARRYRLDLSATGRGRVTASSYAAETRLGNIAHRIAATDTDPEYDIDDVVALEVQRARSGVPWAGEHPVDWAARTDRIAASSAASWHARHQTDPAAVEATLRQLYPTPHIRVFAAALGIADGPADTDAEYAHLFPPTPAARSSRTSSRTTSISAAGLIPEVDASPPRPRTVYRNPVEELRATHPELVAAAERGGRAPTMFAGGDLPSSSASGIDPKALAALPWRARLAAAWEPTLVEAHRLAEEYADPELGAWMSSQALANHPAVRDYIGRVNNWAATSGLDAR